MPAKDADTRASRAALMERDAECGKLRLVPPDPNAGNQPRPPDMQSSVARGLAASNKLSTVDLTRDTDVSAAQSQFTTPPRQFL
jgi:hypothetical protein